MSNIKYEGEFQGPEKRLKDAIWFKNTHFTLGGEK